MPDQTAHLAALRGRHSGRVYVSVMTGTPVLTGTLSATPTLPALALSYTLTSGNAANVAPGMRVVITAASGAYKGTLSVRYAGSITSSSLPTREYADLALSAGDTLTVYDDLVLTDKLVSGDADFAPDHAAYVDQNSDPAPVAHSGGWWAGWLGVDVPFTGSGSYTVDPDSGGTVTHHWDAPGGTFVVGNSASADPTLRYSAAGRYVVTHTVTDASNGKSETQFIRVRAHDADDPPHECILSRVEGDLRDGFRATFAVFEDADLAALPDGAPVIVWTDAAAYGSASAGRAHIISAGYLRRDQAWGDADGDQIEFEVISPLARLAELPGFSKALIRADAPDHWNAIKALTVRRGIVQLLRHYTNALSLFDLAFDGFADADYPAFYLQKATPYEQAAELADARDARLTCDRAGRLTVARRLELTPLADRAAVTTTLTLNADDVIDYAISREHAPTVETFRARGFTADTNQPAFARYPASPGRGSASPVSDRLIVDDAADLLERCALRAAWENRVYLDATGAYRHAPEVRLTLFGGYAPLCQFYREWIKLAGVTNLRGVDLAAFRFVPLRVRVDYAGGTATTLLELRAETGATGAVEDTPAAEIAPPTEPPIVYPPVVSVIAPEGALGLGGGTLAVFDGTNSKVHITTNFDRIAYAVAPTFTGYALALGGTLAAFAVRADSPKYVGGSGAVSGYLATTTQARTISDIFGARTLGAAQSYADMGSPLLVQLQSERGDPANAICLRFRWGSGHEAHYTTDGGGSWAAASGLPGNYDPNGGNYPNWVGGIYVKPDGSGTMLTTCFTDLSNNAAFYASADGGATWSQVTAPGWTITKRACRCVTRPLGRPDDVLFFGDTAQPFNIECRLYRVIGATRTEISPVVGGTTYGVALAGGQRALSVADDDPNALVLVGTNDSSAGAKFGVFHTFNALDTAPTWTPIIAPDTTIQYRGAYYVNRATIYLYGDGGALALCRWNGSTWAVYETVISGCGAIVGICGG